MNDTEKILGIERLLLEVICFNFTVKVPFPYVIKMGRALRGTVSVRRTTLKLIIPSFLLASKQLTLLAWRLTVDR